MPERGEPEVEPLDEAVDHVRGPAGAHVILEYGDYECPYSRRAYREIQRVERELGGNLRFAFRHFPLTEIHPHALAAARAAEAAARQGRYWEMHEILYHRQRALGDADLREYASEVGLDLARFDSDFEGEAVLERDPPRRFKRARVRRGHGHADPVHRRDSVPRRLRRIDAAELACPHERTYGQAMSEPARRLPVILVVDDEPTVLAAVARDLRQGFGESYRIVRAGSGEEALEVLRELVRRGEQVALLVADQRMPGLSGTDYLVRARELVPTAKRVLLTAYADTEAAIQAINEVDLDYYLLKPWDPPEEKLFPVVGDLVRAWEAGAALEAGGVRLIGHRFSRATHELRDFLARNLVPARWLDVERDAEARQLLKVAGVSDDRLPVALLEDGTVLERPTVLELAERLGVAGQPALEHYDLVIVGGGPAGLAAAVYGASEGLKTIMVEREGPGGQAGQSSRIENYLGFPAGLSGSELTQRATTQARRLGAELLTLQDTTGLRAEGSGRIVELSGGGSLSASTRSDRIGGFLSPAERAGIRRADRTGRLLRRRPDRRARMQRPARRRDRRGQLRRPGGRIPLLARKPGDDARPRRLAGEVDVALPDRAN